MQGSSIAELAKETSLAGPTIKQVLAQAEISVMMVAGGKRKIEYFDRTAAVKAIEDYKLAVKEVADKASGKTPAATGGVVNAAAITNDVIKAVEKLLSKKEDKLFDTLKARDDDVDRLLKSLLEASRIGQDFHEKALAELRDYVKTATTKLSDVEKTTDRASKEHVAKLHDLRTSLEQRLSTMATDVNQLVKSTNKLADDINIRMELIEDEVTETNSLVKSIHAMLQGAGLVNPLIPVAPPAPAAAPAQEVAPSVPEGPLPLLGIVGFLDRQASEIADRLKGQVELRVITSQARNPSVNNLKKCERVFVAAAFTNHSLQEKLDRNSINYVIMPTGSMTSCLRTIEEYLGTRTAEATITKAMQ